MNVILQKDVKNLGKTGDQVSVKKGFARNFLIPKDYALPVNKSRLKLWKHQQSMISAKKRKALLERKKLIERLASIKLKFEKSAQKDNRLFGSLTAHEISQSLESLHGLSVDKRDIHFADSKSHLKTLGEHSIKIRLDSEHQTEIKLSIKAKENLKKEETPAPVDLPLEKATDSKDSPDSQKDIVTDSQKTRNLQRDPTTDSEKSRQRAKSEKSKESQSEPITKSQSSSDSQNEPRATTQKASDSQSKQKAKPEILNDSQNRQTPDGPSSLAPAEKDSAKKAPPPTKPTNTKSSKSDEKSSVKEKPEQEAIKTKGLGKNQVKQAETKQPEPSQKSFIKKAHKEIEEKQGKENSLKNKEAEKAKPENLKPSQTEGQSPKKPSQSESQQNLPEKPVLEDKAQDPKEKKPPKSSKKPGLFGKIFRKKD